MTPGGCNGGTLLPNSPPCSKDSDFKPFCSLPPDFADTFIKAGWKGWGLKPRSSWPSLVPMQEPLPSVSHGFCLCLMSPFSKTGSAQEESLGVRQSQSVLQGQLEVLQRGGGGRRTHPCPTQRVPPVLLQLTQGLECGVHFFLQLRKKKSLGNAKRRCDI